MKKLVIDTCVILDIIDEARPRHTSAEKLLNYIRSEDVVVRAPMHALFEISAQLKNPEYRRTLNLTKVLTEGFPLPLVFVPIDEAFFSDYYSQDLP